MLQVSDAFWRNMQREFAGQVKPPPAPQVVNRLEGQQLAEEPEFDVVVCGGTLGILVALSLRLRGHSVAVVDRRLVEGRTQEWNISRHELHHLVDAGLLSDAEANSCIVSEFNPIRAGFKGMEEEVWSRDLLNLGVCPKTLLAILKTRFVEAGGVVMERHVFRSAEVLDNGARINVAVARGADAELLPGDANRPNGVPREDAGPPSPSRPSTPTGRSSPLTITSRLLLDCMGHYSPIVKQMRDGTVPDGMLLVCGGCADGFPAEANTSADLLYTFTDGQQSKDMQYFWEAFPAQQSTGPTFRTTYMFAYTDAAPGRPSLEAMLDDYFALLPQYQGVSLDQLSFQRVLFGGFPCYADSPLKPGWDRVLQIGDASAVQSPLSFGGFGSMVRHLPRLTEGIDEALQGNHLRRSDLALLTPYLPSLSAAWLFQRSMGFPIGSMKAPAQGSNERTEREEDAVSRGSLEAGLGPGSEAAGAKEKPRSGGYLPPDHVNRLLQCNFSVMKVLGDRILRPFLQDTLQFIPLSLAMAGMSFRDPVTIVRVVGQVGPTVLVGWFRHYISLGAYTLFDFVLRPFRGMIRSYHVRRWMDAFRYGSAADYEYIPGSVAPNEVVAAKSVGAVSAARPAAHAMAAASAASTVGSDGGGMREVVGWEAERAAEGSVLGCQEASSAPLSTQHADLASHAHAAHEGHEQKGQAQPAAANGVDKGSRGRRAHRSSETASTAAVNGRAYGQGREIDSAWMLAGGDLEEGSAGASGLSGDVDTAVRSPSPRPRSLSPSSRGRQQA